MPKHLKARPGKDLRTRLVTRKAYAEHRGVTPSAVTQAIAAGRITIVDDRIDVEKADAEWAENTDLRKPCNSVTGRPKGTGRRRGRPPITGFQEARTRREIAVAHREEFALEQDLGLWCRRRDVERTAFAAGRAVRDRLGAFVERMHAVLPAKAHRALEDEVEQVLTELSNAPLA